jgi:hypothetical protein
MPNAMVTAAVVHALRDEHTRSIEPARARDGECFKLYMTTPVTLSRRSSGGLPRVPLPPRIRQIQRVAQQAPAGSNLAGSLFAVPQAVHYSRNLGPPC